MHLIDDLRAEPNALAEHYSHFRVARRLLLTGHSHQAWPDVARDAQLEAFDDAAERVDHKWSRAFEKADRVKRGFQMLLGDRSGSLALAANTHDLLIRFLSALPLEERPRLVTTDGEFHSIRRQLERLEEAGFEVVRASSDDPSTLAERLAALVDDRTAAVLVSTVLFGSGRIVPGLGHVVDATQRHGAEFLLDTYHQLAAVPFSIEESGLGAAFAVGGGYKYCQLGEGNCFLRVPPGRDLRPVVTGWYAEFEDLQTTPAGGVAYGRGAAAFAGATYDPTSHYRGAAVFDFFDEHGLDGEFLRRVSQHQVGRLSDRFDALDLPQSLVTRPAVPLRELGPFLTLRSPHAGELAKGLRELGVSTDVRGQNLRFGPAPYLCDRQLDDAMAALGDVAQGLGVRGLTP
ncbi:MAG: kynureninase [Acidobacteriota bacterium]